MSRSVFVMFAASHLLMVMAGVWLARQSESREGGGDFTAARGGSISKPPQRDPQAGAPASRAPDEWRGGEYARAWKAVRTARFTTKERIRVQCELLKQWAKVDLTAAIDAALAESWDAENRHYGGIVEINFISPLLESLSDALAENPQEVWNMIRGSQFGMGTALLYMAWIDAVGKRDPLFLVARLREIPAQNREEVMSACSNHLRDAANGVSHEQLLEALATYPEDMVSAEQLFRHAAYRAFFAMEPAVLKEKILAAEDGDGRMMKVNAMVLGSRLYDKSPDEVAGEIQGMRKDIREEVLWSAFTHPRKDDATVLGLLDLLIQEGAWTRLARWETVNRLRWATHSIRAEQFAEWATALPPREETNALFDYGVEVYLRGNMENSRLWIAGISNRAWRDRAYAAYSRLALDSQQDPAASRWALDRISDVKLKAEAIDRHLKWEQQTGGKVK